MSSPSKRPSLLAIVLAVLLPVLLVAGLWFGGHPEHLPGFLRDAFVKDHQNAAVEEALQRIARDYYRKVPSSTLNNGSISGAVASLDDRFSHYLSPNEFREFNAPPHFAGIGLIVGVNGKPLKGMAPEKATALIKGTPGTDVKLQVEAGKAPHRSTRTVQITRATVSEP